MFGMEDAIHHGITHIQVGRCHIDFCPEHTRAVLEFTCTHMLEQVQIFLHGPVAKGTVLSRPGQGAPVFTDFPSTQVVNVGLPLLDELYGVPIELIKIVGGIIEPVAPIKPKPSDILHDGIYIFNVLLARIGVIKSQIADAPVFRRQAEIEADGLGVSDMEITVGLRGKPRMDAAVVFVGLHILGHDTPNKILGRGRILYGHACDPFSALFSCILLAGFSLFKAFSPCPLLLFFHDRVVIHPSKISGWSRPYSAISIFLGLNQQFCHSNDYFQGEVPRPGLRSASFFDSERP
jgi:hypothetical protein